MDAANYALYLPPDRAIVQRWGAVVTAAGFTRIPPDSVYPPLRHPTGHLFTWERGRVLSSYQLIYISGGSGRFESREIGSQPVGAGTFLVLFPGVWHRYRPHRSTGWVEHWIELVGPGIERLQDAGAIQPAEPLLRIGPCPPVVELFERCHAMFRDGVDTDQAAGAMLGLAIVSLAHAAARDHGHGDSLADVAVRRAQVLMSESIGQPIRMEALAEELGIGYSYFRRAFAARTGLSPKQYYLRLRIRRAQDLISSSDLSIRQIAETLGFDSQFHLSKQFRQYTAMAPSAWRAAARRSGPATSYSDNPMKP